MSRTGKGLGWRPNGPAAAFHSQRAHKLLAMRKMASPLPPLDKPSLLPFRGHRIDQGGAGACVAFATSRSVELYCNANELGRFLPSPLFLYGIGRLEEWAGHDPAIRPPLEDTGTEPHNMMIALAAEGFVSWTAYPYTDDPAAINREPPPNVYEQAFSQRGVDWAVVGDVGSARAERARQSLLARMPFMFGVQVDEAFMDNHGERIATIDGHRLVGGHMLTGLAVLDEGLLAELGNLVQLPQDARPGDILFDNWWGTGKQWGTPDGFGVMAGSLFGSLWVSDVTLFQGVPPVPALEAA